MSTSITLSPEAVSIVKSSIDLKRRALELNLQQLRSRLKSFEEQYQMSSQQFSSRFASGELGDNPEWFEWEYLLDTQQETTKQLQLLESVKF